jgi:hypothetical protein
MQQHNPNLDLICLDLIELAKAADQLRNRSSIYALKRLCAIRRAQGQRIMEQQENQAHAQKEAH